MRPLFIRLATRLSYRKLSTSVVKPGGDFQPRAFLQQAIPPPPNIPSQTSLTTLVQQPRITVVPEPAKVTSDCLGTLNYVLLFRRRTPIPALCISSQETLEDYVESQIVYPIIHYVNVLTDKVNHRTLGYRVHNANDQSNPCVRVDVFNGEPEVKFPVLFFLPSGSFKMLQNDPDAESARLSVPKSAIADSTPELLKREIPVVITDFSTTVLITKMDEAQAVVHGEVSPPSPSLPLRYLLASFITKALPRGQTDFDEEGMVDTSGAPNNPKIPAPSDDEVLATRQRHTDLDRYTLETSRPTVAQFLRWKDQMRARPKPEMVGAVLDGETNAFEAHRMPLRPRYAREPLPEETEAHMRATKRPSFPQFSRLLRESKHFSLALHKELIPEDGSEYERTFVCSVVAVDGRAVTVDAPSKLCVKLFDDASVLVPQLKEDGNQFFWMQYFHTAEEMLKTEEDAYVRLEHAWGSVVPWFFGTHRFTLPDGRSLFGMVTEFVEKSEKKLREHSEASQISFIQSARHAVRVLQYADISQSNWEPDQQIVAVSPGSSPAARDPSLTCVLVDFALTTQGNVWYEAPKSDDFSDMAYAIWLGNPNDMQQDGVPKDLINKWYGPGEEWDFYRGSLASPVMDEYSMMYGARHRR